METMKDDVMSGKCRGSDKMPGKCNEKYYFAIVL